MQPSAILFSSQFKRAALILFGLFVFFLICFNPAPDRATAKKVEFTRAVSEYVQGHDNKARSILRKILARNPDHQRERRLFEELGGEPSDLDSSDVETQDSISRRMPVESRSSQSSSKQQQVSGENDETGPLKTAKQESKTKKTAPGKTLAKIKPDSGETSPGQSDTDIPDFSPVPEKERKQSPARVSKPSSESPKDKIKFYNQDYSQPAPGEQAIYGVEVEKYEKRLRLKIIASGSVSFISSRIYNPPMIIVDVPNSVDKLPTSPLSVELGDVARIRHSQYRINPINTTRVVIDLKKWNENYRIRRKSPGRRLIVDIWPEEKDMPPAETGGDALAAKTTAGETAGDLKEKQAGPEMTLRKISGKTQKVKIQEAANIPLTVSLTGDDKSVAATKIVYKVLSGDGKVDANLNQPGLQSTTQTNEQGFARARFFAGQIAGENIIEAFVPKYGLSLKFRAIVQAGKPEKLIKVSGDQQQAQLGQEVPEPLVVEVQDTYGNPVPGVRVRFGEKSGKGMLDVDLDLRGVQRTARTDKNGRVEVDSYQISSDQRKNEVEAIVRRPDRENLKTTFLIHGQPQLLSVDFKQANLQDVLRTLAEIAGWDIALSEEAQGVPLQEMKVTVHLEDVTALKALDTILDIKSLARVTDGNIMKIVSKQRAVQKGIPVITPEELKDYPGNNMVTVTYKLRFLQANSGLAGKLQEALMAPESSIIADESSNALVVTDLVNNQRRLNQIINQIDRPDQLFEVRVFELEYRDAEKLANNIKSLLPTGQGNVVPSKGTNSMLIFADPSLMNRIEKLVNALDSSGALLDNFRVVRLEGYDVTQIARQVNAVLGLQTVPLEKILNFDVEIEDPEDLNKMLKEGRSIELDSLLSSASIIPLESVDRIMIFGPKDIRETAVKMINQLKRDAGQYLRRRTWRWITVNNLPLQEAKSLINRMGGITIQTQLPASRAFLLSSESKEKINEVEKFLNRVDKDVSFENGREIIVYSPQYVDPSQLGSDLESYYEDLRKANMAAAGGGGGSSEAPPRILYQGDNNIVLVVSPSEAGFLRRLLNKLDSNLTKNQAVLTYSPKHLEPSDLSSELDDKNIGTLMYEGDNRISLLVPATQKEEIREIIEKIDAPSYTTRVYYLRHTRASEIIKSLQTIQKDMDLNVTFSADAVTNSIIYSAPRVAQEEVKNIISRLDRWQKQVYIEGIILEYSMNRGTELGNQMIVNPQSPATSENQEASVTYSGNVIQNFSAATRAQSGEAGLQLLGDGTFNAILNQDDFQAIFSALASKSNSEILAKPLITAINNEQASIRVGDEQQIRIERTTDQGVVSSLQSVSAFTELRVTPTITRDRYVLMDLMISSDDFTTPKAANVQTQTTRRTTQNSILVKDGQTVVIGGLIQEQENTTSSGIPYLKEIPVLGYLFESYSTDTTKRELVVFLTPHVIESPAEARRATKGVSDELRQITPMPVNLNISRVDQIARMQGLSPEKGKDSIRLQRAKNIVRYRNGRGPFRSLDELLKVSGINEKILNNIAYKANVKINLNTVAMEDLLQLRGIDVKAARAVIQARKRRKIFSSLSTVRKVLLKSGISPDYYKNYLRPIFYITAGSEPGSSSEEKTEKNEAGPSTSQSSSNKKQGTNSNNTSKSESQDNRQSLPELKNLSK